IIDTAQLLCVRLTGHEQERDGCDTRSRVPIVVHHAKLLAEISGFGFILVVRNEPVDPGATNLRSFPVVKQCDCILASAAADKSWRMGFGDGGVLVGAVPCPGYGVSGNSLRDPLLAMKALVLDEEPNLTIHDVIDLLRFVLMGFGMIAGRPGGDHEAAFIAVALFDNHGSGARFSRLDSLRFRNIAAFNM